MYHLLTKTQKNVIYIYIYIYKTMGQVSPHFGSSV